MRDCLFSMSFYVIIIVYFLCPLYVKVLSFHYRHNVLLILAGHLKLWMPIITWNLCVPNKTKT